MNFFGTFIFATAIIWRLYGLSSSEEEKQDPTVQDDEVEILLRSLRNESCFHCPIDQKMAHKLDGTSFPKFLRNNNVFAVLFWLNVDTVSRAVLHITIEASTVLTEDMGRSILGTVACHDWPDICNRYDVITWPRLILFKDGAIYKEYRGVWDSKMIANWIKMFLSGPLRTLTSVEEIQQFSHGKGLDLIAKDTVAPATTLAVLESLGEQSDAARVVSTVATRLHGRYILGAVAGEVAKMWLKNSFPEQTLPLVLTFKPMDKLEQMRIYPSKELCENSLEKFIAESSRPTVMRITETSFPAIYRLEKPFLIAIGEQVDGTDLHSILGAVATDQNIAASVSVAYLEKDQSKDLTKTILKLLKLAPESFPLLIVSDSSKGALYQYGDLSMATTDSVKMWVQNIAAGKEQPSAHLEKKDWKTRPLMYDYKGFIYGEDSLRYADWLEKRKMMSGEKTAGHTHEEF